MMNATRQRGLTLLELTVTLLILAILTTVALKSTSGLQDQARYEADAGTAGNDPRGHPRRPA
jgi:prepilin-type N-terminal cleavage/methylation domain-containing protein